MTHTWTPTVGSAVTLCHGTERGVGKATGPRDEILAWPEQTQVINRIRAASARPIDRKNRLYEYTWTCSEQYATVKAATSALHKRRSDIGRSGVLTISNDGQTLTYSGALLDIVRAERDGLNITWTYKVTAETFAATGS